MTSYTTRVELHSGTAVEYEILHDAMADEGFSRLITSDDGITYHLPTAEYNYTGNRTRDEVHSAAKRAAAKTSCSAGIIVTESAGRSWSGLDKVKKNAYA